MSTLELEQERPLLVTELPADLQRHVLEHLNTPDDLARAAATCSQWRRTVKDGSWPAIKSLHTTQYHDSLKGTLEWTADHCPNIQELNLCKSGRLHAAALVPIRRMPLQVLVLPKLARSHPARRFVDALSCTLRVLEIPGVMLNEASLGLLQHKLSPGIKTLHVSYHGRRWTSFAGLQRLMLEQADELALLEVNATLEYLTARNCRQLTVRRAYHPPSQNAPQRPHSRLKEVDLSGTGIEDGALVWLATCCPDLEKLSINSCRHVNGNSVLGFLMQSTAVETNRLRSIGIGCLSMSSYELSCIFLQLGSKYMGGKLLSLDLSSCSALQPGHLIALTRLAFTHIPNVSPLPQSSATAGSVRLKELWLAGCHQITTAILKETASGGAFASLALLDLSFTECLSPRSTYAGSATDCISTILDAASTSLQVLLLDGAKLPSSDLLAIGQRCPNLQRLSLIGVNGVTDKGLTAIAQGCPTLNSLALGGSNPNWTHDVGLAAFSGLTELRLSRRTALSHAQLTSVLERNPQLKKLTLSMCNSVTDRSLEHLPRQLQELSLVCCQAVAGTSLSRLSALEVLKLPGCTGIKARATQDVANRCKALRLLELPSTLRNGLNQQTQGVLVGLKVEGGRKD